MLTAIMATFLTIIFFAFVMVLGLAGLGVIWAVNVLIVVTGIVAVLIVVPLVFWLFYTLVRDWNEDNGSYM